MSEVVYLVTHNRNSCAAAVGSNQGHDLVCLFIPMAGGNRRTWLLDFLFLPGGDGNELYHGRDATGSSVMLDG